MKDIVITIITAIVLGAFFATALPKEEPYIGKAVFPVEVETITATPTPTEIPAEEEVTDFDLEHLDCVSYSDEDIDLLYRCVEAEAGDQGCYGKMLVARVILNRVNSSEWANTIAGVIYQENQFEVVRNGRINCAPTEETIKACNEVLAGWDESHGAMYFRTITETRSEWHYTALEWLFDYEGHSFFR